ncbi:MAG: sensor N-terminal transmembrane domain-containing protein, partial [Rhodobacteraceae bacterium]|nr:sensor N-terminal transmembrane domain-containing protein [Paracoccaceae bacterium]
MAKGDENIPSMLAIPDTVISLRKRKFFSFDQSPLARKIIVFNLIALGILVSGVLYLNQTDDGQVSLRRDVLAQQAKLVAISLAGRFGSGEISESYFLSLTQPIGAIVRYYDQSGKLLYQHNPDNLINADGVTPPKRQSALTNMMQNIWEALSGPIENSAKSTDNLYGRFDQLVNEALAFPDSVNQSTFTSQGDLFVSIAEPVKDDGSVRGVVLLSTVGGEIDGFIRDEREQILQIFVLAILSSIALSIVLANSIARPLRRLSEAAETAHANAGGRLNPAMIQIPDLTARPDEIGDLSRAMRKMIEALFERIEENKNFAADVAHEIKNPLTSLRSAVETMELPLEPEDRSALLLIIRDDVDRLDRLVTDISNASR